MLEQIWIDYEEDLRRVLNTDAQVDGILASIRAEGYEPNLHSQEIDDVRVWACPIQKGIFSTVQRNHQTGMTGQEGSPSSELAALEGLRRARNIDRPKRPRENPPRKT